MTTREGPLNASVPPPRKQGRRALLITALLALILTLAGYTLWWRPIQAERALENASLEELRQIILLRPGDARVFYHLGLRYERAKPNVPEPERTRQKVIAYEALSQAAELAPDDEDIWIASAGAAERLRG